MSFDRSRRSVRSPARHSARRQRHKTVCWTFPRKRPADSRELLRDVARQNGVDACVDDLPTGGEHDCGGLFTASPAAYVGPGRRVLGDEVSHGRQQVLGADRAIAMWLPDSVDELEVRRRGGERVGLLLEELDAVIEEERVLGPYVDVHPAGDLG